MSKAMRAYLAFLAFIIPSSLVFPRIFPGYASLQRFLLFFGLIAVIGAVAGWREGQVTHKRVLRDGFGR